MSLNLSRPEALTRGRASSFRSRGWRRRAGLPVDSVFLGELLPRRRRKPEATAVISCGRSSRS
jgi:hypothetical protein